MEPILLVRADASETFGVAPGAIREAGGTTLVWDAIEGHDPPDLSHVSGVVLFGSSYNVEHADDQPFIHRIADLLRDTVDRRLPYLGVCFGAQALAWALGSPVAKAPVMEVGYVPFHPTPAAAEDALLSHYADGARVFQWHMDTFELPAGAILLGTGDAVRNQAFRLGDRSWGIQFHFEVDRPELEMWLEEVRGSVEQEWGRSADDLLAECLLYHERHEEEGREVFRRFVSSIRELR